MQAHSAAAGNAAMMATVAASSMGSYVTLVQVEPAEFEDLLTRQQEAPLVVYAEGGFFTKRYRYLSPYRGLGFYCISPTTLRLPDDAEVIRAKRLNLPA